MSHPAVSIDALVLAGLLAHRGPQSDAELYRRAQRAGLAPCGRRSRRVSRAMAELDHAGDLLRLPDGRLTLNRRTDA